MSSFLGWICSTRILYNMPQQQTQGPDDLDRHLSDVRIVPFQRGGRISPRIDGPMDAVAIRRQHQQTQRQPLRAQDTIDPYETNIW